MTPQRIFEDWFYYTLFHINEINGDILGDIKNLVEDTRRTAENNNYNTDFIDEYVKEHSYIFED